MNKKKAIELCKKINEIITREGLTATEAAGVLESVKFAMYHAHSVEGEPEKRE